MIEMPKKYLMTVFAIATALMLSGCETTGDVQEQMAGAGIGAILGCGVGAMITHDARGCAAGAAVGGLMGFGIVQFNQYQAKQVRSSAADRRVYGLSKPVSATQVKIRKGTSAPKRVKPGQSVNIVTDYSLMLPKGTGDASVTESWVLKKDGKEIAKLPTKKASRAAGGWKAEAEITIPDKVEPGSYTIEHRVKAGSSYDTDESTFTVRA